jgi:hypothetical protein
MRQLNIQTKLSLGVFLMLTVVLAASEYRDAALLNTLPLSLYPHNKTIHSPLIIISVKVVYYIAD